MSGEDGEAFWAHVLWQNNGLRMEDFLLMTKNQQLAYIASYMLERDKPVNRHHAFIKGFFK